METAQSRIQALAAEHAKLGSLLNQLGILLSTPLDEKTREALVSLLEELAICCRQHMKFEERGGYLSGVLNRHFYLASAAERLRREHAPLQQELAEILAIVKSTAPGPERLEAATVQLQQWLARVREHEIQENSLVQEAFNADLGGGD